VGVRQAWRTANPLALVGLYAVGVAATIAWIGLLPGEPSYEGPGRSAEVAVSFSALLVFFLARGSRGALLLGRFAHLLGLVYSLTGLVGDRGSKLLGLAILQVLIVVVLFSPSLERYVIEAQRRRRR
jgi:hypothetical protein